MGRCRGPDHQPRPNAASRCRRQSKGIAMQIGHDYSHINLLTRYEDLFGLTHEKLVARHCELQDMIREKLSRCEHCEEKYKEANEKYKNLLDKLKEVVSD